MTDVAATHGPAAGLELACFELGAGTWAVPIACVREIVPTPRITPLPDTPDLIEGVMDLRGTLIPVLDLASLLVRGQAAPGPRARTVVVEARGLVLGFRVDRATEVANVDASALEPLPALAREAGCRVVGSVVRRGERPPVLVVDLAVLIEQVLTAGRAAGAAGEVAA